MRFLVTMIILIGVVMGLGMVVLDRTESFRELTDNLGSRFKALSGDIAEDLEKIDGDDIVDGLSTQGVEVSEPVNDLDESGTASDKNSESAKEVTVEKDVVVDTYVTKVAGPIDEEDMEITSKLMGSRLKTEDRIYPDLEIDERSVMIDSAEILEMFGEASAVALETAGF